MLELQLSIYTIRGAQRRSRATSPMARKQTTDPQPRVTVKLDGNNSYLL